MHCDRQFGIIIIIYKGMCQRTCALVCKLGVSNKMMNFYLSSDFILYIFLLGRKYIVASVAILLDQPNDLMKLRTIKYRTHSLHMLYCASFSIVRSGQL